MKDWIQISINAIVCIAVLGVLGIMALFYRQMQTTNTVLIDALNNRPSAAENPLPSVEFILHRGSIDGPLAEGIRLDLRGKAFNEDSTTISEVSDTLGQTKFGPIRAGRYRVTLTDEITGLRREKQITLYSGDGTKTFHIPVPPAEPIALDTAAPLAQHISDKDFRLFMSMKAQWSHEGEEWKGDLPGYVIVTPKGIFPARNWLTGAIVAFGNYPRRPDLPMLGIYDKIFQTDERITETYGNRLTFGEMFIAESHHPEEDCEACFMVPRATIRSFPYRSSAEISYDLRADGADSVLLDVPGELLRAYEFYVRWKANSDHGLPAQFSWFPVQLSEEYKNFVLDEARLVEQSLGFHWANDQYTLYPSTSKKTRTRARPITIEITGQSAQLFSLKNAPKSVPDGYRLLLAFNGAYMEDLNESSANLCAYLVTSPASYDLEEPVQDAQFPSIPEPVWKLDTDSLVANLRENGLFVDLTDAIEDDAAFGDATGLLFKWEAPSKNSLILPSPETNRDGYQPVWLIMKPFTNAAPSNADAD